MQAATIQTTANLNLSSEQIREFCQRWNVHELALFGSVLRDDFRPDSDVDILVTFNGSYDLETLLGMEEELNALLGRNVDLIVKRSIEHDPNYIRRKSILNTAQVVYAE